MKAILSEEFGLDALELREVEGPVIEDDQVLVRVTPDALRYLGKGHARGKIVLTA
jgi:hypothetical protein